MIKMITKNRKLNFLSEITKQIRVCCGLAVLLLMSGSAWAQSYCTPEGTNSGRYISSFSTTSGSQNITNPASGFSVDGYGDFTSLIVRQGPDGVVNFTADIVGGTAGIRIWVDWGNDGIFDPVNDVAYASNGYSSSHSGSFTVPPLAAEGPTRMRVVSHWLSTTGSVDPCATGFSYGEFEDYTFDVAAEAAWDCPTLLANIGDACDDGDPNTTDDTLNADCECEGIPPAANDEACTATTIACGETIVQSLIGATSSLDDACFGSGSADVWFSFTIDGSQMVTIAENSSFDAVVQIFAGADCADLADFGACKDTPEYFTVTQAGTYFFRVRPYYASDDEGTISVSLTCVDYDCPIEKVNFGDACDDGDANTVSDVIGEDCLCAGVPASEGSLCSNSIPLVCNADPATYSSSASNGSNTTACTMGDKGLWFSFMGTGGDISVNSTATFDHEMSINRGTCADLIGITCKDGSSGAETYTIASSVLGEMYYVYIARYNSGSTVTGDITIDIDCATPPLCTPPSLELAVQDAGGNAIEGCLDSGSEYHVLATLSGGDGNDSYNVSANNGATVEVDANESIVLGPFTVGNNVNVTAVGAQDEDCDVSGSINSPEVCPAVNDECANAIALICGESLAGTTIGATVTEGITQSCANFGSKEDVFYTLAVTEGLEYTVAVAGGSDYDGVLAIFTGSCNDLTQIAGACKDATGTGDVESFTFTAAATETVTIRTYDYYTSKGSFTISVTCGDPVEMACTNTSQYGSANVSGPGVIQISTCNFLREYSVINGVNSGYEYEFTGAENNSGNLAYITVRAGSADGAVIGTGMSPLTIIATSSDDLYVHWNADTHCGTTSTCATTTARCITCATVEDCEGVVGGSALPGTACDDGDPSTVNDIYGDDCICAGVPPAQGSVCETAIPVVCDAEPVMYSSAAATGTNTTECFMGDNGLWFSFMGTGFDITVNVLATFDHEISINSGSCDNLTNIDCQDEALSNRTESYTITLSEVGTMYYVYAASFSSTGSTTGDITIDIDCADAPPCTVPELTLEVQDAGGNAIDGCVDAEYYVLATLSGGSGNDSYYLSLNSSDAEVVNAGGSMFFGPYSVGTSISASALGVQNQSCVAYATASSPVRCAPANDNCENAFALSCGGSVDGTTAAATNSGVVDCVFEDVFYKLDVEEGTQYTIAVIGSLYNGLLAIHRGSCDDLTLITCVGPNGVGEELSLIFTADATETLIIATGNHDIPGRAFTISVDCEAGEASLNGNVMWNSNCGERNATVKLYEPGTATQVASYNVSIQSSGSFNIPALEIGTFDVIVKVDGYLAKGIRNVEIAAGANNLAVGTIRFGDLNGDNKVDYSDVGLMSGAFLTQSGQPGYNPIADSNCDSKINYSDVGALSLGFPITGDKAPLAP